MNRSTLKLAAKLAESYAKDYQDYLDECDQYRRDGYTPHYCEHGSNRWTDYDNICGGCEDGWTMADPNTRRVQALVEAKRRMAEVDKLTAVLVGIETGPLRHLVDTQRASDYVVSLMVV